MQQIPLVDVSPKANDGKIYVRLMAGRFQTLRRLISWPMLAAFFLFCWVRIEGAPILMFSFAEHQILLFGLELSWYDLQLLGGLLIAAAAMLFFLSMLAGRVWCGFACPQSIWTWLFIRIEDLLEGKANRRAKQDKQPLKMERLARRSAKHLLWSVVSIWTAVTFSAYFMDGYELLADAVVGDLPAYVWGWLLSAAGLTYLNAGLIREKICLHACPYSRFQSVMLDDYSRVVTYNEKRGEPRQTKQQATAKESSQGACIDCTLCVQVCPTGIDIRQGLQAACINCGACIDACDSVMAKIKQPLGLIAFSSEAEQQGRAYHLLRPRLIGYFSIMLLVLGIVAYGFTQTTELLVEFNRERGAMYSEMGDGEICNFYKVKAEAFNLEATVMHIEVVDKTYHIYGNPDIELIKGDSYWRAVRLCTQHPIPGKTELDIRFSAGESSITKATTFFAPRQ